MYVHEIEPFNNENHKIFKIKNYDWDKDNGSSIHKRWKPKKCALKVNLIKTGLSISTAHIRVNFQCESPFYDKGFLLVFARPIVHTKHMTCQDRNRENRCQSMLTQQSDKTNTLGLGYKKHGWKFQNKIASSS